MDFKSKGSWTLPVIVAVGAFAYYCATLKPSTDAPPRRREVLQRLYDDVSPRTLLNEGYTRSELLDGVVPRTALTPPSPRARVADRSSPSTSQCEVSHSGLGESHNPLNSRSDGDIIYRLYRFFCSVSSAIHAASDTLVEALRGSSSSNNASLRDLTTNVNRDARPRSIVGSPVSASEASSRKTATRSSSICLTPDLFINVDKKEKTLAEMISPERSRSRTPGGALQVHIAALSAAITRGYTEESATYCYPLEVLRFLHEDGSRLSIMAESLLTVESEGPITTEVYVRQSLARAHAAADATKAYFKVKLFTAARNIATTMMESYVNAHVGPSPVIFACFYLVSHGVAYTIQLQTHSGVYEERLSDLLYTAQSARVQTCSNSSNLSNQVGRNVFRMQAEGVEEFYLLEVPLGLVARAEAQTSEYRNTLILTPCNSGENNGAWSAKVEVRPLNSPSLTSPLGAKTILEDSHVVITLTINQGRLLTAAVADMGTAEALKMVNARRTYDCEAAAPLNAYVSPSLTIPLPPPEMFRTTVCEHAHDPYITLFIATTDSVEAANVFEVELRCMNGLHKHDIETFFAYLETLFLTPSRLQHTLNSVGQEVFAIEGLAAAPEETSLCVYGVRIREGSWLVVRWLYTDCAVFPRELERYRRVLLDEVVCRRKGRV